MNDRVLALGSRSLCLVQAVARTGVVIEDYADMVIDSESVGRDWAPVHRWAIALDDGRLIFADDDDLAAPD
ncbi:hypothetical protein [Rhodococcus sp. AD45]|uniref:hypothetical protein n=1 Tax=Rhodococcus sp. WS3 TaxID=2486271 RepID=UPI0005D2D332